MMAVARYILGICFLTVAAGFSASAQPAFTQREQYDRLFQAALANPSDFEVAFQFAEIAGRLGEYEAAIGVLERMIFFNPGLLRVRLELGVLYFRLGSYGQAKTYLTSVLDAEVTPADVRLRVQSFLTEIDRRQQVSQFSGFAQFGLRHQTNGNAGPNSLNVRVLGFDAVLDSQFGRRPDWNIFGATGLRHVYDFETQGGDTWETNLAGYGAWQQRLTKLDLQIGEINTGPRLAIPGDVLPGWNIRPYAILGGIVLARNPYQRSSGAGISTSLPIATAIVEVGAETRRRVFYSSSIYPTASEQTGELKTIYGSVGYPVMPGLRLLARGSFVANEAGFSFNSYRQTGFDLGFSWEFASPLLQTPRNWTLTAFVGGFDVNYRAPNFVIDPTMRRKDREYHVNGVIDMPITEHFGVTAQLSYVNNESNLPNFRYQNFSVSFGPTARF
jgi:hypothetical protein